MHMSDSRDWLLITQPYLNTSTLFLLVTELRNTLCAKYDESDYFAFEF